MDNILDSHVAAYNGQNLYDFDNNIQLNWYPQRILRRSENAKSILELGLGHGITTAIFSNHFDRHLVLDASPAVIENFRKRFPDCPAEIIETYFEDFVSDEKFDLIVLGFILEHVDDPVEIMRYYKRFLVPGGKMFVTVPNAEVLNRRLGHLAGMLENIQQLSEHDLLLGHKRYYTVASLRKDIMQAGYQVKNLEGIYLKPLSTNQMLTLNLDDRTIRAFCVAAIDYPELSCGIFAELSLSDG